MLKRQPTSIELNHDDLVQLEQARQIFFQRHLTGHSLDTGAKASYEEALIESQEFLKKREAINDVGIVAITQHERRFFGKDHRLGMMPPPSSSINTAASSRHPSMSLVHDELNLSSSSSRVSETHRRA
jgi:hypothetical protein